MNETTVCVNCRDNSFLMVSVQGIEPQCGLHKLPSQLHFDGLLWMQSRYFILMLNLVLNEKQRKWGEMQIWSTDVSGWRRIKWEVLNEMMVKQNWQRKWDYLKEKDDVPDEAQDNRGVSVSNISCIDTDQLYLSTHVCYTHRLCVNSTANQQAVGTVDRSSCYLL